MTCVVVALLGNGLFVSVLLDLVFDQFHFDVAFQALSVVACQCSANLEQGSAAKSVCTPYLPVSQTAFKYVSVS